METPMATPAKRTNKLRDHEFVRVLKPFLARRKGIYLVFLFGSSVSRRVHPASDVDIGILFGSVPNVSRINALAAELSSLLKTEVDLVVLNHASPILKMQVLKKGVLVFTRDLKVYHQFFVDTVNQYDDLKRIRKTCEDNILRGRIYA
jgi:predicted nucleotidyltransferase